MSDESDTELIIYIDRSDVDARRWDELEAGVRALVAFVDRHQPQIVSYGVYFDHESHQMTVVAVHPDSASLENHIDVGGPEFKKLASFIELRSIEIFGQLSERAAELVRQKAADLGDRGVVTVQERFAGFGRIDMRGAQ